MEAKDGAVRREEREREADTQAERTEETGSRSGGRWQRVVWTGAFKDYLRILYLSRCSSIKFIMNTQSEAHAPENGEPGSNFSDVFQSKHGYYGDFQASKISELTELESFKTGPSVTSVEDWGVNYRALNDLFNISQSRKSSIAYEVGVQMVEIYNEQVRDLLRPFEHPIYSLLSPYNLLKLKLGVFVLGYQFQLLRMAVMFQTGSSHRMHFDSIQCKVRLNGIHSIANSVKALKTKGIFLGISPSSWNSLKATKSLNLDAVEVQFKRGHQVIVAASPPTEDAVVASEPLTKEDLVGYLFSGCKPKENWRIGTEHEKFGFEFGTLQPMKYEQIAELLNGISERFDWEKIMEGDKIIGLKQVGILYDDISLQRWFGKERLQGNRISK
ncbi:unnamed protein product [Fraxinus pennsylvanica]|uniref:Kinesin motor domain-containing protein n=1 Tax=Fraxinus pennsylvanica TaxID=56036 RepID=A0AAD2E1H4_9LAMI|nr:unnamed protein product [Fraxinus pennsylvanica]